MDNEDYPSRSELDEEGIPEMTQLPQGISEWNADDGMMPPRDFPQAVDGNTTAGEQLIGESLEERLEREEPEVSAASLDDGSEVGPLMEPDSEIDEVDITDEAVAIEGREAGGLSAEEAAMHIDETTEV